MIRRIPHDAAPFLTEEAAHEAGKVALRQLCAEEGGSPMGWVVEPQPDGFGFYVRVGYTVAIPPATPRGRKRREQRSAEIGFIPCPANTAARVALIAELRAESEYGQPFVDGPDSDGDVTLDGVFNLDRLASAVARAVRKVATSPAVAGDDQRQGVTEAGHAVLDMADDHRAPFVKSSDILPHVAAYASMARAGGDRRQAAIMAGAFAILAIEAIDEELRS